MKEYNEMPWEDDDDFAIEMAQLAYKEAMSKNEHVGDGYNHPGDGAYDSSIPSRVAARKHPKRLGKNKKLGGNKKQGLKLRDLMGRTRYGK